MNRFPFPIPNNAYEAIWNHKLKYKGLSVRSFSNQAAPTAGGAYTLTFQSGTTQDVSVGSGGWSALI